LQKRFNETFGLESFEKILTKWETAAAEIDRIQEVEAVFSEFIDKLDCPDVKGIAGRLLGAELSAQPEVTEPVAAQPILEITGDKLAAEDVSSDDQLSEDLVALNTNDALDIEIDLSSDDIDIGTAKVTEDELIEENISVNDEDELGDSEIPVAEEREMVA